MVAPVVFQVKPTAALPVFCAVNDFNSTGNTTTALATLNWESVAKDPPARAYGFAPLAGALALDSTTYVPFERMILDCVLSKEASSSLPCHLRDSITLLPLGTASDTSHVRLTPASN